MPYTTDDLTTIREAIVTGASKVRFADGRETTFRSLTELREIEQTIVEELAGKPRTLRDDRMVSGYSSGLSRGRCW